MNGELAPTDFSYKLRVMCYYLIGGFLEKCVKLKNVNLIYEKAKEKIQF